VLHNFGGKAIESSSGISNPVAMIPEDGMYLFSASTSRMQLFRIRFAIVSHQFDCCLLDSKPI
jgi:hypothetical protein